MFDFIIQGYPFTALLLFFLYCFHGQARSYYFSLARTANVLLWVYLFVYFIQIVNAELWIHALLDFSFGGWLRKLGGNAGIVYSFGHYCIILIALLFKNLRKQAVWILVPFAFLARPDMLSGDFLDNKAYTALMMDALLFLLFTIFITYLATSTKENIAKKNARLPDRI